MSWGKILDFLEKNPNKYYTTKSISNALNLSLNVVYRSLKILRKTNWIVIVFDKQGTYSEYLGAMKYYRRKLYGYNTNSGNICGNKKSTKKVKKSEIKISWRYQTASNKKS